jgi:hypothetical protein
MKARQGRSVVKMRLREFTGPEYNERGAEGKGRVGRDGMHGNHGKYGMNGVLVVVRGIGLV